MRIDPTFSGATPSSNSGPVTQNAAKLSDAVDHSQDALRQVAVDLEAAFLTEMLTHTGLGARSDTFGGGAGEDTFSSFLTQEYARLLAERGGVGLSETIFEALVARDRA